MGATPATLSREDLKASVDELIDEIVHGDDTHWQDYLNRMATERANGVKLGLFRPWSANNRFNVLAQVRNRHDSVKGLYAGHKQWSARGRSIIDGARPYIIYGPPSYLARNPGQNQQPAATAQNQQGAAPAQQPAPAQPQQPQQQVRMFRRPPMIEVYDWTQTVADDPDYVEPDWGVPLAFGDLDTLSLLAATSPVPVTFRDIGSRNEHGWLDATGITVDSSMPVGNQIFTLLHELGHHHLGHLDQVTTTTAPVDVVDDDTARTYATCEQEAALVQFLAMKMLGLDEGVGNNITEAAGAYLRSWTRTDKDGTIVPVEGHKTKRKLVLKRFDIAIKAADAIIGAYAQALEERAAATAA